MSREIKFRVWDKQKKCFLVEWAIYWYDAFKGLRKNLIAEQYTGLKDKNGKEIYEGDIISFENEKGLARVLWLDGKAMFGLKWLDCGVEDELDYWNVCRGPTKVIGNIHENPELLEDK